jgi:hypothetical protein
VSAGYSLFGDDPSLGTPLAGQLGSAESLEVSMVRTFCKSGENEAVKGAVHAAGCLLAGVMAAYNIAAWCYRREPHLGINAVVYSLATLWEVKQTAHHLERCDVPRDVRTSIHMEAEKTEAA